MSTTMRDICYGCGKSQDYGTMHDINHIDFDIFCDDCFEQIKEKQTHDLR